MIWYALVPVVLALSAPGVAADGPLELLGSMERWAQSGGSEGSFVLDAGTLSLKKAEGLPGELLTAADYENFELRFEFNVASWTATGLYLHAPRNRQYPAGLELELSGHPTGHDTP